MGGPAAGQSDAAAGMEERRVMAYGRHLARECAACHRLDDRDDGIPAIVGWPSDTLVATLKLYRTGARTNPVMVSVANSLSDVQMTALAAYLASLPRPQPAPTK
jgi:cytochrome c553